MRPRIYTCQTGKGGAGKSTLIALLYSLLVMRVRKPILIKSDPNPTCAALTGTDPANVAPITDMSAMLGVIQKAIELAIEEDRDILIDVPADGTAVNGRAVNPAATLLSIGVSLLADLTVIIPVQADKSSIAKALEILTYYAHDRRARLVLGIRTPSVDTAALDAAKDALARWPGGSALLKAVPDTVAIPEMGTLPADWQAFNAAIPDLAPSTLQALALRGMMATVAKALSPLLDHEFPEEA